MATDTVVSRELKSLQEELSTSQREHVSPIPSQAAAASGTTATPPPPAEERELRDQLRELSNEVKSFFEEAEKGVSAHPAQSVISALLVGILIGRLLGRR